VFPVVIWLMMYQRLRGGCSMASAVAWLRLHAGLVWPEGIGCKRILEGTLSAQTGAYCQARQGFSTLVFSRLLNILRQGLYESIPPPTTTLGRPVFVVDGTTLRLAHQRELVEAFPPGQNQHGENHWPVLQVVAFHEARTGLAEHPRWGPMYGARAVSEQNLAAGGLDQLPADAVVIADANFGIFHFAYRVHQSQRVPVVRLTQERATKILGRKPPRRLHCPIRWEPSVHERRAHPDLPEPAHLQGWLVVCTNPQRSSERLFLFTTLELEPKQVLDLYKLRWNIETDLRHLKRTVNIHQLTGKSTAMIEKELLVGIMAYNLVCGVRSLVAYQAGLVPRQLSFTYTLAAIEALPWLDPAAPASTHQAQLEILASSIVQMRLPNRSSPRSFPRAVWGRGGSFPSRRSDPRKGGNS
jgi:hypothetical protein